MKRHFVPALAWGLAAGITLVAGAASAQAPVVTRYRGVVEQLSPTKAEIKTRDGKTISVDLTGTKFVSVTKSDLSEIKPDSYIGTASIPQPDGTQKALEVSVFDASMRGMGDGSYPWDSAPSSTMTNGAVGSLVGASGRTMTVQYKGGEKKITVPEDVPIVHLSPADISKVKVGSHVIAFTTKEADGTVKAGALLSGQDGTIPPM
jgi:hypothetical protein